MPSTPEGARHGVYLKCVGGNRMPVEVIQAGSDEGLSELVRDRAKSGNISSVITPAARVGTSHHHCQSASSAPSSAAHWR